MTPLLRRLLCLLAGLSAALAHCAEPVSSGAVPRFTHPGAGQTFYFLLTDRFANGRADNDTGGIVGGPDVSGYDPTRISHFHGGDIAGVTAKLEYLKNLGVTAVWVSPPFKNKPMQEGTAGYHGYWVLDFLHVDPHLGTDDEYRELVRQAHARGLKVYMDIIVNHTADVIKLQGDHTYRAKAAFPYRDAAGRAFDPHAVAYNGLNDPAAFPALSAERSFPYTPVIADDEKNAKNPAWLNDPTLYHNRGNSTFAGESSVLGDFVGLDDVFTEHPRVVQGFIAVFHQWLELGIDGFRIDTARHVNAEFWQAFAPAIRARARALGRPDFLQFGEVYNEAGDPALLSEYSTGIPLDTTIDFGFFVHARKFVSQAGSAADLGEFFTRDDYYTDHDSNVHSTTTFLGNHDAGRFGYYLQKDNKDAAPALLADLTRLGHGLLLLARGQPVLYYGDEQGMIGRGGGDMQAREDMFPAQAPDFKTAPLLATTRTGADDKFDEHHPFYLLFRRLGALRAAHAALRTGAMLPRATGAENLFAFSRIERGELVEYLCAFNNSRDRAVAADLPTSQRAGAHLARVFDSRTPDEPGDETLVVRGGGTVRVSVAPLQFAVWRATTSLAAPVVAPTVALAAPASGAALSFTSHEADGQTFPSRQEIRAEVAGGDGVAEVTFALARASRPGQWELLGTDDAAPYRVFWSPPADLAPGEKLEFIATVNDLRGHQAVARIGSVTVAPSAVVFGIAGAKTPRLTTPLPATVSVAAGAALTLSAQAEGSGALEYQWLRDDEKIAGATAATYTVPQASAAYAGRYRVLIHNLAGTAISSATNVTITGGGRLVQMPAFPSQFVSPRRVDVWLPPGYDEASAESYPVVYFHDGQNVFDPSTSYIGVAWSVDQALLRLIAADRTRGAIIVGIWNTPARIAEYMPQKGLSVGQLAAIGQLVAQPGFTARSDAYLKFLVEELKPYVDRAYRTLPDAAHTAIMGSSMGGLISAYAVAEYPQVFGAAGCVSTAWPVGDGAVIAYLARHLPKPGAHRFYFDSGTETLDGTYEPFQQRMDAVMRAAGYTEGRDWLTRKFPGEEHSERSWRKRVDIPLEFLLKP